MLKIGEFSRLTHVSVRMLHYYDNAGLLKPALTDPATGYRYYSVSQVPVLQKIVLLRDLDFQVAEIMEALAEQSEDILAEMLRRKIREKQDIIKREELQIKKLETAVKSAGQHTLELHSNILFRKIPELQVISLRRIIPDHFSEGLLWEELSRYVKENHIGISRQKDNNIAVYYDMPPEAAGVDTEVCFLTKKSGACKEPFQNKKLEGAKTMACMMIRGDYGNLSEAYQIFARWLEEHGYQMAGPCRQICHCDHTNESQEENYLTEIQIPVALRYPDAEK